MYVQPKLGYFPYYGHKVNQMLKDAVITGNYKRIMKLFRTTRVDPNEQDELGNTVLHYAHEHAYVQIICLLGTHHADFTIKNKKGQTPYDVYEESVNNNTGEPWMIVLRQTLVDEIIRAQYRFQ
jgi:predicted ATP-grasp superfamily ATP-dependent carboligase